MQLLQSETQKQNVQQFNSDIETYGGYLYSTSTQYSCVVANRRMTQATVAAIPKGTRSLIDIGCGDGTYTGELARAFPATAILGVDPAPDAIERARRLFPSARFAVGDLLVPESLPAGKFEVGVLRAVVHHLPDGAQGIARAARLCGTLIVVEPNGNNPVLKWNERHKEYYRRHEEQSFTDRELRAWCRSAGYRKVTVKYIGFVPMFFPEALARIIHLLQPMFELIHPLRKYLAAQIVLLCEGGRDSE